MDRTPQVDDIVQWVGDLPLHQPHYPWSGRIYKGRVVSDRAGVGKKCLEVRVDLPEPLAGRNYYPHPSKVEIVEQKNG